MRKAEKQRALTEVLGEIRLIWETYAGKADQSWRAAAAYLRESKDESLDGFSPGAQIRGILDEALRRQLWIAWEHVFLDARSGRTEQRFAFQDVLALARTGKITEVIVLHTSRFSRNAMVSRKYKDELRGRGVAVTAINAPFDVGRPEGKFAERMLEAVDEFTSDTIGWWVGVGLREKHEKGEPLGRLVETFYKNERGEILPEPVLSPIVLDGARRYVKNPGFGKLAAWSDRNGYRTPSGRRLTDEWWRNVLANPLNAGFVGYRRKRGGIELRKATFDGFIPLDLFQKVAEVRRARTYSANRPDSYRAYPLSGALCGKCKGRVTAAGNGRMRCRRAAQHAGCDEPSVPVAAIEAEFGTWLTSALHLGPDHKMRLAKLVHAFVNRGVKQESADAVRKRMKRLTDAWTWGGMEEADYREELRALQAALANAEQIPNERKILEAIRLAQDFAALWVRASHERRKQVVEAIFETVTVLGGMVVSVKPKPELAPLFALQIVGSSVQRCGPDRIRTGDLVLDRDVC